MSEAQPERSSTPLATTANGSFLLLLLALPWMKHGLAIHGLEAFPVDLLSLVTLALWIAALLAGQARLRLHPAFALLALYFAALAASAVVSSDPPRSGFKLLTQIYLLLLPVLGFNLLRTAADLKRAIFWWVAAAIAVGAYGVATVLLFPIVGPDSFLREPLHNFGTLPAGSYPRIELTFEFPAMLTNYLAASLMMLLVAYRIGWVGRIVMIAGAFSMLLSAFFALTPGFGGIVAMLGFWIWYIGREGRPVAPRLALAAACGAILLEVLVAAVTPFIHPTAPFLIHLPGISEPLAPAIRLLAWTAAAHNFLSAPILGHGIGLNAVYFFFRKSLAESGGYETDAHNVFLSVGAQCGLVGVAALVAIIGFVLIQARRAAARERPNALLFGLCLAWLCAFAVQGLVGSFEDARHLWLLFGLILAAQRFDPARVNFQDEAAFVGRGT